MAAMSSNESVAIYLFVRHNRKSEIDVAAFKQYAHKFQPPFYDNSMFILLAYITIETPVVDIKGLLAVIL